MSDLHALAKPLVSAVAERAGVEMDADEVLAFAKMLADLATDALAKRIMADAEKAAAGITTLETAEESARKAR